MAKRRASQRAEETQIELRTELPRGILPNEGLPDGWAQTSMVSIANVVGGGTPNASDPRNFSDGGYPWITPADLSGFRELHISKGSRGLSEAGLRSCSAVMMPTGTVLMSSRAPIGYLAIARNPVCTNQGFKSFVCNSGVEHEFVYFWLKLLGPQLESMGSGSTFLEISGSRAKQIPILLAPTAEQRRIAAQIGKALPSINSASDRLSRVPRILRHFRQAVLAAACSGRLTEDWREDRIETLQRRSSDRNTGNPTCDDQDLRNLPSGWTWALLSSLGADPRRAVQTGPFGAQLHRDEFTTTGVPVIAVVNLTGMGFTTDGLYYISEQKAEQLAKYDVQAGDVLFARSGATLGKVCVAPEFVNNWRMTGHILRARLDPHVMLPEFAAYSLHGDPAVKAQVTTNVRGVTRPGFNTMLLEMIRLPLPSMLEQREILARVKVLFEIADSIEARLTTVRKYSDALTQSILAKAFRGELVPTEAELARREGREYESASILLERIKQEQEAEVLKRPTRQSRDPKAKIAIARGLA
jgi:type I restriction enzyme, S subunit